MEREMKKKLIRKVCIGCMFPENDPGIEYSKHWVVLPRQHALMLAVALKLGVTPEQPFFLVGDDFSPKEARWVANQAREGLVSIPPVYGKL